MGTISELKEKLEKMFWLEPTKCSIVYIFDSFGKTHISYQCENINEFSSVIKVFEPYKMSFEVGTNKQIICSPYNCTIENNYHDRKLKISFEILNDILISATIDFKNLDSAFISEFFNSTFRGLYDTETVYVNIPSHYKKFKSIRIQSYNFKSTMIHWYGGNKTCNDVNFINKLITYLK